MLKGNPAELKIGTRQIFTGGSGLILVIMLVMMVVGLLVVDDFGQSWDEDINYYNGERSIRKYRDGNFLKGQNLDYYHGTFYFMIWSSASKFINSITPQWRDTDGRHLINYVTFVIGVVALYLISKRTFGRNAAIFSALLFASQPLFFGHAFINQKDIPFMVFWMVTILFGLQLGDSWSEVNRPGVKVATRTSHHSFIASLVEDWKSQSVGIRIAFLILIVSVFVFFVDLASGQCILSLSRNIIIKAYSSESPSLLYKAFRIIAEDADKTPLSVYLQKLDDLYFWARIPAFLIGLVVLRSAIKGLFPKTFVKRVLPREGQTLLLLLTGISLGLTQAIRIQGIFVGMLISLSLILQLRRRSGILLAAVWVIAFIAMYAAWPTLWGDPFNRIWERIMLTTDFTKHQILFEGMVYSSEELPWHFLPKILPLQFTEPGILLFLLSLPLLYLGKNKLRDRSVQRVLVVMLLWFFVPILLQVVQRVPIYDNFRQFLFAMPPIFILAGWALETLRMRIRQNSIRIALVAFALAPGIVQIVRLHPYQYMYYNSLVGGVRGAEGRYELDYWCTAYREAMGYVNQHATSNAIIQAWGPYDAANAFAREDVKVYPLGVGSPQYILGCDQAVIEPDFFNDWVEVYEVSKLGVQLGTVRAQME